MNTPHSPLYDKTTGGGDGCATQMGCLVNAAFPVPPRSPSAIEDPIGWHKYWLARNPGKAWADAAAAWKREVL